MNINQISRQARARSATKTSGMITFECGCAEHYSASSAEGFAIVAGLAAQAMCERCGEIWRAEQERRAAMLPERLAAFEAAVAARNARMAELGIADIYDTRITGEVGAVFAAYHAMRESSSAAAELNR